MVTQQQMMDYYTKILEKRGQLDKDNKNNRNSLAESQNPFDERNSMDSMVSEEEGEEIQNFL